MKPTFAKRLAASATMALAGSLSIAAVALADGAGDNESRVTGAFTPNLQDDTTFGKGALHVQVETDDRDGDTVFHAPEPDVTVPGTGPYSVVDEEAEQVFIDFDDDFKFTVNRHLPTCDPDTLTGATTQAALAGCPRAVIGNGSAMAQAAPSDNVAAVAQLTVTAFNGPTTTEGPDCQIATDSGGPPGCEFSAGNPQILLHARSDGLNTTSVTRGQIVDSERGADFGKRLEVTDAPDVNNGNGSLNLFGSMVQRSYTNGKTGDRKKTYQYVSAICGPDDQYDFHTEWEYDDQSTEEDSFPSECNQK